MLHTLLMASATLTTTLAQPSETQTQVDYPALVETIDTLFQRHYFDKRILNTPAYHAVQDQLEHLGQSVDSDEAFMAGFQDIWRDGPSSHVNLQPARGTAEQMAAYLDTLNVGEDGAVLSWDQDIAILTVNTMMGLDTIDRIEAAYDEIADQDADGLIIDLRHNGGGAFAVLPLVSHLLSEPLNAGVFVNTEWLSVHDRAPEPRDYTPLSAWKGWSIRAFWEDVDTQPMTRIEFEPATPTFKGPVMVLTSAQTASAAELAADALKASGKAILIGETTAGQMLSQKPFDVGGRFHLFLPIADYYSASHGRIEGQGVTPHVSTSADEAMETALARLRATE